MFRAAGLLLLAVVGYIIFIQYERHELNSALEDAVRNASTRFTVQAKKTIEKPSGITISESLSSLQTDVSEIEKLRITLQQRATTKTRKTIAAADAHLQNVQSALRAVASKTRSEVSLNVALRQHKAAMSSLLDSVLTPYFDNANRTAESALDDVRDADADYQIAFSQLTLSLNELYASNSLISQQLSKNESIDPEIIKAFAAETSRYRIEVNYVEQ